MNPSPSRGALAVLLALSACSAPQDGHSVVAEIPPDLKIHVNFHGGLRSVDHPLYDDHATVAVEVEAYRPDDLFGYELGVGFAADDAPVATGERDADFFDVYLGLRKTFAHPDALLHPYIAVGGIWMVEEVELVPDVAGADETATGAGGYARAGLYWTLQTDLDRGAEFTFGFDVRGVFADDTDFVQGTIFLGVGQ